MRADTTASASATAAAVSPVPWVRALMLVVLVVLTLGTGAGVAVAGWGTSTTGASTARAGALTAPTGVATGTPGCAGLTATVRVSWSAVPGAVSYQVDSATNAAFTQGLQTVTATTTSATVSRTELLVAQTVHIRVRAVAGAWSSAVSPEVTATMGPCLL